MTLDQYIAAGLPSYEEARQHALILSGELKAALDAAQSALPPSPHRVVPQQLVDGRWLLRAALLTEIDGGIYAQGFAALNPALFPQVQVLPWADAVALLPQPEEGAE